MCLLYSEANHSLSRTPYQDHLHVANNYATLPGTRRVAPMNTSGMVLVQARSKTRMMFVTAWIELASNSTGIKTPAERSRYFSWLAASGIPLLVFVSPQYMVHMQNISAHHPNIARVVSIDWKEMETYQIVQRFSDLKLPVLRSGSKDTHEYMALQLSKAEFLDMALQYTEATHLAWIDFSVAHMFKTETPFQLLRDLQHRQFQQPLLLFAGCWQRGVGVHVPALLDRINWRFAGSFFLGDRDSVHDFFALSCDALSQFLEQTGVLVWEVNFWAWLEDVYSHAFRPLVYMADHSDNLVAIPEDMGRVEG